MLGPVCVKCNIEMRCVENAVEVMLMAFNTAQPYQAYVTNEYLCPICGCSIRLATDSAKPFWTSSSKRPVPAVAIPVWAHLKDALRAQIEETKK